MTMKTPATTVRALGYIGVAARSLDEWRAFAGDLLAMQIVEKSESELALRLDARMQRIVVQRADVDACLYYGWEVDDAAALHALATRLADAGVAVAREPHALAEERSVSELISFSDPAGNRVEAFHGAVIAAEPFRPPRPIGGFRTGDMGLGHAVLLVRRLDEVRRFYQELLGFRLSDYMRTPFKADFFHVNGRHHSLAFVESDNVGLHHLMVELNSLDDVGHAYDIAQTQEGRVAVTLGRHSNDLMISFYARSPSGFMVEYGWGGRQVDPATWQPVELTIGPSLWGHERHWLPAEQRAVALELRLRAAAEGLREPVQVMADNHYVMAGDRPK
jgi:2,3-dihydroxybiphenyl 1,2-dioxygenase